MLLGYFYRNMPSKVVPNRGPKLKLKRTFRTEYVNSTYFV